jgi:hypothetical protein
MCMQLQPQRYMLQSTEELKPFSLHLAADFLLVLLLHAGWT